MSNALNTARSGEPTYAQLRTLVELASDGIFIADTEGRYTFVNQAGCRLLACEPRWIIGKTIFDLIPDQDASRLLASKAQMLRGDRHVDEWKLRRRDGTWVPVEVSAKILPDGQWQGIVRDISERKTHEAERDALFAEMDEKQRVLQTIFEILPIGVWLADSTGRIISNNPAGERIWRGARYVDVPRFGEYRGWWVDTGQPIAAEDWALARAITKGATSLGELIRIQCFDGSFKTIINSAAPLRDAKGTITGAICVNEDISALHDAQEQYRRSERLFRTVFELLPVGLWVADKDGHIKLANPAGERIWEGTRYVKPDEFAQYKGWWLQSGKRIEPDEWGLSRAIRRGETSKGELIRIQCFDGSFKTVINWAAPIRSDTGEILGAIAMNEDITALQQTQEQLRKAVRDREQLLAVVAHDLRNPLAGIMMAAKAAEQTARTLSGGEQVRELAAMLLDASRGMSGLVDDLLAVAVASTGGKSMLSIAPVTVSTLMERAAGAARPLVAKEGLVLEIDVPEALPSVKADAERILRVFANLLDNALKFTTPPGRIRMAAERSVGGVRFSVANSGPPLSADQLKDMFQPFWQGREDTRGSGLGLSICRSIIEAHGGTIWAEPVRGERVRVCFVLPS